MAADVTLQAPLSTKVVCPQPLTGGDYEISAVVEVPERAPKDLGVGAFVSEGRGWFQRVATKPLGPGTHEVRFAMSALDPLKSEPYCAPWNASAAAVVQVGGLFFWASSADRTVLKVEKLTARALGSTKARRFRLQDVDWPAAGKTGGRCEWSVMPDPFPANPYDPAEFALDAEVVCPDGSAQCVPGFYFQPMRLSDRGDRESASPNGFGSFIVRYRPRQPGVHQVKLIAAWGKQRLSVTPPSLPVSGEPWDDYVRVDRDDTRFFSRAGKFFWPVGPNLRSINDERGHEAMHSKMTPDRGAFSYAEYLDRLAIGQCTAVEVWMSGWSLGLEWSRRWEGFYGQGRYNQANAWRLDRVLDHAYGRGVRLNLVTHNHGQASEEVDKEWDDNPYNKRNGGQLSRALEFFTSEYALAGQENLRRYVAARYADHPGILGWKLWTEMSLTAAAGNVPVLKAWHERAAGRWRALDSYAHPVGTHWHGSYHHVNPEVASLPGLDYICINAYNGGQRTFAHMAYLCFFGPEPRQRMGQYRKPILITEYGCNFGGGPDARMRADHASGAWSALVSGLGGAPMLWWFEWMDQGNHYIEYQAIARYLKGEDPRGVDARSIGLTISHPELWSRAWARPGRMLGYVVDKPWGWSGDHRPAFAGITLAIGDVKAGAMTVEWWNADTGAVVSTQSLQHPGGALSLAVPEFSRHLAFKLWR
jgi:hypothetical protein